MSDAVYDKGYIDVGDGHELYYERWGNPEKDPAVFLHGGPGSGFSDKHKQLFDPDACNILFYDQRGAGKSKPYLSLEENTSQKLTNDIQTLLDHFDIAKATLVGASWGVALGFLFAIKHPKRTKAMVLANIFLATHEEIHNFVDERIADERPRVWERFISHVPEESRDDIVGYYLEKMREGNEKEKEKYFYHWALYDISLSTGKFSEEKLGPAVRSMSYKSLALLTAYYIKNDFFLPDNYILDNIDSVRDIPTAMIQSSEDIITPERYAKKLDKVLQNSTLHLIKGEHAGKEAKEMIAEKTAEFTGK